MTRNYCDRCSKEIEGLPFPPFPLTAGAKKMDLCNDCKREFEEFMRHDTQS